MEIKCIEFETTPGECNVCLGPKHATVRIPPNSIRKAIQYYHPFIYMHSTKLDLCHPHLVDWQNHVRNFYIELCKREGINESGEQESIDNNEFFKLIKAARTLRNHSHQIEKNRKTQLEHRIMEYLEIDTPPTIEEIDEIADRPLRAEKTPAEVYIERLSLEEIVEFIKSWPRYFERKMKGKKHGSQAHV